MQSLQYVDQFLNWLFKASWQAAVLVLMVLAVRAVLRRRLAPSWRCYLWLLVGLRLVLPVLPASPWSIFNYPGLNYEVVAMTHELLRPASDGGISAGAEVNSTREGLAEVLLIPFNPMICFAYPRWEVAGMGGIARSGHMLSLGYYQLGKLQLFGVIWFLGVMVLGGRLWWNFRWMEEWIRREPRVAEGRVMRIWESARLSMGVAHEIPLVETDLVHSPALSGVLRPRLLLPRGMTAEFSDHELRLVFLHELAHYRRGDLAMNWLMTGLQVVHWFNPVLWWGFKCMRTDREVATDAMVLAHTGGHDRKTYGRTIIRLLEDFSPVPVAAGAVGLLEDDEQFKERIGMLAGYRAPTTAALIPGWCAIAGLALVGLTDRPPAGAGSMDRSAQPVMDERARQSVEETGDPGEEKTDFLARLLLDKISVDGGSLEPAGVAVEGSTNLGSEEERMISDEAVEGALDTMNPDDLTKTEETEKAEAGFGASGASLTLKELMVTLTPYGDWFRHAKHGLCWVPNVSRRDPGWRPYRDGGQWMLTDAGWYWRSDYVWGWIAFHYGNWERFGSRSGWYWIPGDAWSAAWVHWRMTPHYLGWAPIGKGGGNGAPGQTAAGLSLGEGRSRRYCFVPISNVLERRLRRFELREAWREALYSQSTPVDIKRLKDRTGHGGLSVDPSGFRWSPHYKVQDLFTESEKSAALLSRGFGNRDGARGDAVSAGNFPDSRSLRWTASTLEARLAELLLEGVLDEVDEVSLNGSDLVAAIADSLNRRIALAGAAVR